jgi:hypothetical protein
MDTQNDSLPAKSLILPNIEVVASLVSVFVVITFAPDDPALAEEIAIEQMAFE